jgi:hypothetical protein
LNCHAVEITRKTTYAISIGLQRDGRSIKSLLPSLHLGLQLVCLSDQFPSYTIRPVVPGMQLEPCKGCCNDGTGNSPSWALTRPFNQSTSTTTAARSFARQSPERSAVSIFHNIVIITDWAEAVDDHFPLRAAPERSRRRPDSVPLEAAPGSTMSRPSIQRCGLRRYIRTYNRGKSYLFPCPLIDDDGMDHDMHPRLWLSQLTIGSTTRTHDDASEHVEHVPTCSLPCHVFVPTGSPLHCRRLFPRDDGAVVTFVTRIVRFDEQPPGPASGGCSQKRDTRGGFMHRKY